MLTNCLQKILLDSLQSKKYHNYSNEACFHAYADSFKGSRRNVVLLTNSTGNRELANKSIDEFYWGYARALEDWRTVRWMCQSKKDPTLMATPVTCTPTKDFEANATAQTCNTSYVHQVYDNVGLQGCNPSKYVGSKYADWTVFQKKIQGCMVEKTEEECAVRFSFLIMWIVLAFNAIKILAMFFITWHIEAAEVFTCVGDAVASFIQFPDPTTKGICLASRTHINEFWPISQQDHTYSGVPHKWRVANEQKHYILFACW
jgi:hypothetical protein